MFVQMVGSVHSVNLKISSLHAADHHIRSQIIDLSTHTMITLIKIGKCELDKRSLFIRANWFSLESDVIQSSVICLHPTHNHNECSNRVTYLFSYLVKNVVPNLTSIYLLHWAFERRHQKSSHMVWRGFQTNTWNRF